MADPKLVDEMLGRLIRILIDEQHRIDAIRDALIDAGVVTAEAIDRKYAMLTADGDRTLEANKLLQALRDFNGPTH